MSAPTPPAVKAIKDQWNQSYVYTVAGSNTVYRRIVGGLSWSWPGARSPSCALCVMGEERDKDFPTGQHKLHVLFESMARGVEDLLNTAAMISDVMKCQSWSTPLDAPEMVRVQQWTRDRSQRRLPRLQLTSPASVDFMVLHNLALKRTSTHKTLFFGDKSLAAMQYVSVLNEDFYRPVRIFPHIAACLYALSILDMRSPGQSVKSEPNLPAEGGY